MTDDLVDRFLAGEPRALPRLISLVESDEAAAEAAIRRLYPRTGAAHVVGITGPPGAGKSSLVAALIGAYRSISRKVGVVAVDPSSARSGGALLGDRIRMGAWHADPGVFVRSLAARGRLGGLSRATADVVHLLDAAGFDPILVETVGAGQDGITIADLAQTVVVVQVPGLGDGVQALKAGLLEIGDVMVVNKADLAGAAEVVDHLKYALPSPEHGTAGWSVPIVSTSATTGDGIDLLREAIDRHRQTLAGGPEWSERRRSAARAETLDLLRLQLERHLAAGEPDAPLALALDRVANRQLAPAALATALAAAVVDAACLPPSPSGGDPIGDQGRGRPGPDPVVDVDDDQPRRAGLEHRRHRPHPPAPEPIPNRSR